MTLNRDVVLSLLVLFFHFVFRLNKAHTRRFNKKGEKATIIPCSRQCGLFLSLIKSMSSSAVPQVLVT